MKFILIMVFFGVGDMQNAPPLFVHKVFNSEAECQQELARPFPTPPGIRRTGVCVSENVLLEIRTI